MHLRKRHFPSKHKSELVRRANCPFEMLERVNDNAWKVNLPMDYGVSSTFNVADLSPYLEDDYVVNLQINFVQ